MLLRSKEMDNDAAYSVKDFESPTTLYSGLSSMSYCSSCAYARPYLRICVSWTSNSTYSVLPCTR